MRSKGTNFHGLLESVERSRGKDARARLIASVEGELGDALRHGAILTGGWYPIAWHDAILRALEETFPGEPHIIREVTGQAVRKDFETLFKVVRLVATPAFALTNATRVMARYFDGGRVSVLEAREGRIHFRFDDYVGFTPRIWEDVIGGMEAVIGMLDVAHQPFDVRGTRNESRDVIVVYRA